MEPPVAKFKVGDTVIPVEYPHEWQKSYIASMASLVGTITRVKWTEGRICSLECGFYWPEDVLVSLPEDPVKRRAICLIYNAHEPT